MTAGTYRLDVAVHRADGVPYDYHRLLYSFRVTSTVKDVGFFRPKHGWTFSGGVEIDRRRPTHERPEPGARSREPFGLDAALELVAGCGRRRHVVFTNGVFDLLHPGHVRYLQAARALGDALIVGVNSDRSVRANKGPSRPLNTEAERVEVLAALACVDAAVVFDEDTPHAIVARIQPDVLVKGADWPRTTSSAATWWKPAAAAWCACRSSRASQRPHSSPRRRSRRVLLNAPALALRALVARAAARLELAHPAPVTAGLTPAAKALAAAAAALSERRPTVLVVPTDKDVDQVAADARFFMTALDGATDAETERLVLPYPSWQVDPYRGMNPHFRVSAARGRALYLTASRSARLIVASAPALLPRVGTPARMLALRDRDPFGHRDRAARPGGSARRAPASRARIR